MSVVLFCYKLYMKQYWREENLDVEDMGGDEINLENIVRCGDRVVVLDLQYGVQFIMEMRLKSDLEFSRVIKVIKKNS